MEKQKSYAVTRSTRNTGMGAYDTAYIYSIRQEKELNPHKSTSSKTGNHGSKTWFLLPGKYFECGCSFSNSGKGDWYLEVLTVSEDGEQNKETLSDPPEWLLDIIPNSAKSDLFPIPHS